MKTMRKFRRPTSREEARDTWAAIIMQLREWGLERGDEFWIGLPQDLPDEAHARATDPDTSKRAAEKPPRNLRAIGGQILLTLADGQPRNSYELAAAQGRKDKDGSVRPRIKPLKTAELIYVKDKVKRPDGEVCERYLLTDEGRLYLASLNGR